MAIEWKTEKSESTLEQVSPDGRWHMSSKTNAEGKTQCYLSNYDLLCGPGTIGESQAECWRKFVENCDIFAKRLEAVRAEAAAISEELEKIGE